jgi:hypothetical protein
MRLCLFSNSCVFSILHPNIWLEIVYVLNSRITINSQLQSDVFLITVFFDSYVPKEA